MNLHAYRVKPGDTFESIAKAHNVSVDELDKANPFLTGHDNLLLQTKYLRIPAPTPTQETLPQSVEELENITPTQTPIKPGKEQVNDWQLKTGTPKSTRDIATPISNQSKLPTSKTATIESSLPAHKESQITTQQSASTSSTKASWPDSKFDRPRSKFDTISSPTSKFDTTSGKYGSPTSKFEPPVEPELVESKETATTEPKEDNTTQSDEKTATQSSATKPCEKCMETCCFTIKCSHKKRQKLTEKPKEYYGVVANKLKDGHYYDEITITLEGEKAPDKIYYANHAIQAKSKNNLKEFTLMAIYGEKNTLDTANKKITQLLSIYKKFYPVYKKYTASGMCLNDIVIRVYSPDIWELEVGFPAWKGFEKGRRSYGSSNIIQDDIPRVLFNDKDKKQNLHEYTTHSRFGKSNTTDIVYDSEGNRTDKKGRPVDENGVLTTEEDRGNENGEVIPVTENDSKFNLPMGVSIICNGTKLNIDALNALNAIIETGAHIEEIFTALNELSKGPKFGLYIKMGFSLMKGGVTAKWCCKESKKSYKAFNYFELSLCLKLINLNAEIGLGISYNQDIGAQVYLKIEGEISTKGGMAWLTEDKPSKNSSCELEISGKIEVEIGLRAQLADFATLEALVCSGVETKGTCFIKPNIRSIADESWLSARLLAHWTGVTGKIKIEIQWGEFAEIKFDFKKEFIEAQDIAKFKWPSHSQGYITKDLSEDEIVKAFEEKLDRWWGGIEVRQFDRDSPKVSIDKIAAPLARVIIDDETIKRDEKTIKLIVQKVSEDLEKEAYLKGYINWFDFDLYLNKYYRFLLQENYRDQALILKQKLQKQQNQD
ncbi:LysM peptidoglycan-binding domain-containing protein [Spartinivicinus poritis]|uniref:LysM domain-containing protein n=1 Tax=Spartinivicinus poritis TaxID=2994640 RepID=A0ABT5UC87_9GAMM|nr:LysM domain-containing protein [Spartinivicinus sp. A2-2]MDE1462719.1 LysM domain-containing protein [Spartinivicinus sp. A2-2]